VPLPAKPLKAIPLFDPKTHPSVPTLRKIIAARRRAGQKRRLRRDRKIFCHFEGKKYRPRLLHRIAACAARFEPKAGKCDKGQWDDLRS
jgi:hypothetical protein